jgi:intracellular septation protein A
MMDTGKMSSDKQHEDKKAKQHPDKRDQAKRDRNKQHENPEPANRLQGFLLLLLDMAGPIVAFYIFRSLGYSSFLSLLLSAVIPGLSTVYQVVRTRHLDPLAIFMMGITVVSAVASLIGGDPRFLLAKDGWVTAIAGAWLLATTKANPPVVFMFARPLMEGHIGPGGANWDVMWNKLPGFRRIWRVASVIWGVATILDAGVRFIFAYTLPVDTVPALNGIQYAVLFVVLQIATNIYYFRAGLYNPKSAMYAPLVAEQEKDADLPMPAWTARNRQLSKSDE